MGPLPGPTTAQEGRNGCLEVMFVPVFPQWVSSSFPGHVRVSGRTSPSAGPGLAPCWPAFLRDVYGAFQTLLVPLLCFPGCLGLHHSQRRASCGEEDKPPAGPERAHQAPSSWFPAPNVLGLASSGAARGLPRWRYCLSLAMGTEVPGGEVSCQVCTTGTKLCSFQPTNIYLN